MDTQSNISNRMWEETRNVYANAMSILCGPSQSTILDTVPLYFALPMLLAGLAGKDLLESCP